MNILKLFLNVVTFFVLYCKFIYLFFVWKTLFLKFLRTYFETFWILFWNCFQLIFLKYLLSVWYGLSVLKFFCLRILQLYINKLVFQQRRVKIQIAKLFTNYVDNEKMCETKMSHYACILKCKNTNRKNIIKWCVKRKNVWNESVTKYYEHVLFYKYLI